MNRSYHTVLFAPKSSPDDFVWRNPRDCLLISDIHTLEYYLERFRPDCILSSVEEEEVISRLIEKVENYSPAVILSRSLSWEADPSRAARAMPEKLSKVLDCSLLEFGFSPALRGYHYLKQALYYELLSGGELHSVKKEVYDTVSQCYHTTIYSVERGISFAIRKACSKSDAFEQLFSKQEIPPSNLRFLKRFSIYVKQTALSTTPSREVDC